MLDTIFVIPGEASGYAEQDLVAALRYGCNRSHGVLFVTVDPAREGSTVLSSVVLQRHSPLQPRAAAGFHCGAALHEEINHGTEFNRVVFLNRDCLVTGQGLDTWAAEQLAKGVGLLGVQDRLNYDDAFQRCVPLLADWDLPYEDWDVVPQTIDPAVVVLSMPLVAELYQRNALAPPGCENWPLPYGPYISWVSQMLGHYQVVWGHVDKHLPPLFVGQTDRARNQPPPHILSPAFLLYYSVRYAAGYSETELREAYKRARGEPAQPFSPLKPVVCGAGQRLTEAG